VIPSRRAALCLALASGPIACRRGDACKEPSVSRLTVWDVEVSKDGSRLSVDGDSSLSTRDGKRVAHVVFDLKGPQSYGTINVPLRNHREDATHKSAGLSVDLGRAADVALTYASTADLFLQIRHGARSHGGHHYRAKLPATGGSIRSETLRFADFAQPDWVTEADRYPLDLHDVFSFTVAALQSADVTVSSLVVDGFTPACE
jgi:hypothetical protein